MQRRVEAVVQAEELIEMAVNALGLQSFEFGAERIQIIGGDALGRSFSRMRFERSRRSARSMTSAERDRAQRCRFAGIP